MFDTLSRYLINFSDERARRAVRVPLENLIDRYSSQAMASAGLVINGAGATFPKIGASPVMICAKGILVLVAAGTAVPAPVGLNIPAGMFGVAGVFVDAAGVITTVTGQPGATLAAIGWPVLVRNKAFIGFLVIQAGGSAFVGGTTALDAVTTTYVNNIGPFDPTILI